MLNKFKSYLETMRITPINWLLGISGILMVRFFLESLSSGTSGGFFASDASTLVHYYLFFLLSAAIILIFLQKALPSWRNVAPQFVILLFSFVLIAPVADWAVGGGKMTMAYLFDSPREMLLSLITFFGDNIYTGVTLGMRLEIAIAILGMGLLIYFVERSWLRALFSAVCLYLITFTMVSLPGIIFLIFQGAAADSPVQFIQETIAGSSTLANNLHSSLLYSSVVRMFEIAFNFVLGKILFLMLVLAASLWFYSNLKEKFIAVVKNSRPERVAHYLFMIFIGIFSARLLFPAMRLNWNDWLSVIVLCLSFYFSWMFAVSTNDIEDEAIDVVSDPSRPLVAKALKKEDMEQVSVLFLVASLFSAFLAGYTAFFFVLAFTALYYIYSVYPTRFKIIPFFSSFLIGLCCLTAVLAGYFLVSPLKHVSAFPDRLALAVVVIFSLLSTVRDMKDIEGDKKAGIKTVPIVFGDVWGPRVVGVLAGLSFFLVPFFMKNYALLISALPASFAAYHFVNKKPYKERPLIFVYYGFVLSGFLLLAV